MRTREDVEKTLVDEIKDVRAELARIQLADLSYENAELLSSHLAKFKDLDLKKIDVVNIYADLLETCVSNDELKKHCKPSLKKFLKAIQTYQADIKTCKKKRRTLLKESRSSLLEKSSTPLVKYDFAIAITNIIARDKKSTLEDKITKLVKNDFIYHLLLEEGEITGKKKLIEFFKYYAQYHQDPTKEKFSEIKRKFLANKEFINFLSEDLMNDLGDLGRKYKTKTFSAGLAKVAAELAKKLKADAVLRKRGGLLLHERHQFSNLVTHLSTLKEEFMAPKKTATEEPAAVAPKKSKPSLFKFFKAKFSKKSKHKDQEKTKTYKNSRGGL